MRGTSVLSKSRGNGGRVAFRRTWMTPGLAPGQLLDAGITVRQKQNRRNIKKAKHPFDVYFRDQFRCSLHSPPAVGRNGVLSARDAARLMTDAEATWGAPWALRAGGGISTRNRRQDALETSVAAFGEDDLDKVIERLIELRFEWDREDGVVATSEVPESLYAVTEHCAPYSPEHEIKQKEQARRAEAEEEEEEAAAAARPGGQEGDSSEYIVIDGTRIHIGKIMRSRSGHPKSTYQRPKWGFTGVDTIPSLVADVVHGPLLSNSSEPLLTLRWKAENRRPESVAEAMGLRRMVMASSVVGLPPRSAFLLLKSAATMEWEDPALDVALLIAVGEHYRGYADTECLELLRCVRRVALARGLPRLAAPKRADTGREEETLFPSMKAGLQQQQQQQQPLGMPLYENAALTQDLLADYVRDTAPFLSAKVWARLPEHSRRLLSQQYYLDWIDLLSLTLETTGPSRLPDGLPNASSRAQYASKYLFFRYTLGIDETVMKSLVSHMLSSADAVAAESGRAQQARAGATATEYVSGEAEVRVKPLVLWVCAAFLVRLVAECLGDVLHHVGQSLQRHAQLAAEEDEACRGDRRGDDQQLPERPDLDTYLDRLGLPRPRTAGVRPLQSRMRATKMRIRLLPYEAFPSIFCVLPTPARGATEQALQMERNRRGRRAKERGGGGGPARRAAEAGALTPVVTDGGATRLLESPFASVLQHSALAAKHVERAIDALEWSTMVLGHCHRLVRSLRKPPSHDIGSFPSTPSAATILIDPALHSQRELASRPTAPPVAGGSVGTENATVIAQREALCERFIKSKVELLMDAVFTHVPWGEVENDLEPLLCIGAADEGPEEKAEPPPEMEISAEAELLALSMTDDDDNGDGTGSSGAAETEKEPEAKGEGEVALSEAEQQMRATLVKLQSGIGDFQIAVADMLDAHERFFGTEAAAAEDEG